jgi:hypothetical protein
MIRNDISLWPLVLSVSSGTPTYEQLQSFSAEWDGWLDCGERFATLRVYLDIESHTHPEGGAREKKRWYQANSDRVKSLVVGMASVLPAAILDEVQRMDAEKLFGVPAQAFTQIDPAINWIGAHLSREGFIIARENASTKLRRLMVE